MWSVYILRCSDGTFYTGITKDIGKRTQAHNQGRGARYTRCRRPVKLVYMEPALDRPSALRREAQIKRLSRARKKELIQWNTIDSGGHHERYPDTSELE